MELSGDPAAAVPGVLRALVARVDFGSMSLMSDDGAIFEATARGSLMGHKKSLGNTVVVGDVVEYTIEGERRLVSAVEPRRNAFSRRASGRDAIEQVVAANLDQIVLVSSIRDPEFSEGFADRVLCQAEHAGIPARLVLNKLDLANPGEANELLADYARAGYPGHAISARERFGLDELERACAGKRSLLIGHSGVGKSTLLNALVPGLDLLMGHVNAKTGKGRHTTTAAWLLRPSAGLELIDTPGVRNFGLFGIGSNDLDHAYAEFRPHLGACKFADCRHDREPGCAIGAAVESGSIPRRRFESFRKLRAEIAAEE